MGLSSAMDWWDEWKLRILVLCSLSIQFILFPFGFVRYSYTLRSVRALVWIAYVGGDAVAIYALATLFNRQKLLQTATTTSDAGGNANSLEVLWAPVLLIHLGGQPSISAYSLEDNELWKRHAITLVSQVTVALYVFCKWWSGEKRLLQVAVLLFIVGILRFSQKPWALRRASVRTMASANSLSPRREERSSSAWRALRTYFMETTVEVQEENINNEVRYSLEEYVKRARELVNGAKAAGDDAEQQAELRKNQGRATTIGIKYVYKMFIDLPSLYSVRLHYLQYILKFDYGYGHRILAEWIQLQFLIMYTKARTFGTGLGACSVLLLPGLALAPVVLFAKSGKDGYNKIDITVTYFLFSGTALVELAPFWVPLLCLPLSLCNIRAYTWQDMVSQHNIMLFCARKKQPTTLMKLAAFIYLRDYINKHWYIWHEPEAHRISALVRWHVVENGWKDYICDAATYRRFSNLRGEQTLRTHHLLQQLLWTFNLPFDEYVLVWHIATDLCFHHASTSSLGASRSRRYSEIMSNYMIYLFSICPEMLMLGTRQHLLMLACDNIENMIKDQPPSSSDGGSIARWILGMEQGDDLMTKAPMISNARKLAKALIDLDDDKMWEVIQGVWVEMLCYSASRCRGYEHAKSLADGGEYLTNVWLLWSVMGMETLPDKMHNPGPPESDHGEEQAPSALA